MSIENFYVSINMSNNLLEIFHHMNRTKKKRSFSQKNSHFLEKLKAEKIIERVSESLKKKTYHSHGERVEFSAIFFHSSA